MSTDNDDEIFNTGAYTAPVQQKTVLDTSSNAIKDLKDLTPYEQMELAAKERNIPILKPKKNCRKCYERGYIGFEADTKMPVPCDCIFPPKTLEQQRKEREQGLPLVFYPAKVRRQVKLDNRRMIKKRMRSTKALELMRDEIDVQLNKLKEEKQTIISGGEQAVETLNDIQKEENV
jgi:hypothetical protein